MSVLLSTLIENKLRSFEIGTALPLANVYNYSNESINKNILGFHLVELRKESQK